MKVTFIHHSAFLVEMKQAYLLFDYTEGHMPELEPDKELLVFASHRHGDHFSPVIFDFIKMHRRVRYILSDDIWKKRLTQEALDCTEFIKPGGSLKLKVGNNGEEMTVSTFKSTDEGLAFLVECGGRKLYHAGDLNDWRWSGEPESFNQAMEKKYKQQLELMKGLHVNAAFLPLDPRQEENFYLGMNEFLEKVRADYIFPMHCWGDFSVISRMKGLPCSQDYRDRIVDICSDGQTFLGL